MGACSEKRWKIILLIYLLILGIVLLITSSMYRWNLHNMERRRGILCPRIYLDTSYRQAPVWNTELWENRRGLARSHLCNNLKWWKLYGEIGIFSGVVYLLFVSSYALSYYYGNSGNRQSPDDNIPDRGRPPKSTCLSNWKIYTLVLSIFSAVALASAFVFLGNIQLAAVDGMDPSGTPGQGRHRSLPLILYVISVWHLIKILSCLVIIGIGCWCPSFSFRKSLGLQTEKTASTPENVPFQETPTSPTSSTDVIS